MNLVVNNLNTNTGNWMAACCSSDMNKIALANSTTGTKGIWTSTNKGASFTQTTSTNIPVQTASNYWRAMTCSNDFTKIIAVRQGGQIYFSTDSGAIWYLSVSSISTQWWCVGGSADLSIVYAGIQTGGIYKSTDYGNTWTSIYSSPQCGFLCCSSDGTKVAVALMNNAINFSIIISTDSGVNWVGRTLTATTTQYFRSICCTPDFTKLAAVATNVSTSKFWTSTDSGANWINRESNIYAGNSMDNVAISASNDLSHIVICNYSTLGNIPTGVYYSVDSGTTFRRAQVPGEQWHATCFSKTTDEFVVVKYGNATNDIYRGTFLDGTTTITYGHLRINVLAPDSAFSSYGAWPRMQIGLSNSIHMPVNCYTAASFNVMRSVLAEHGNVSSWPSFDPYLEIDYLYFFWKYGTTTYYNGTAPNSPLFTGQHKTLPDDPTIKQNLLQNVGLIMSSNDTGYTSCDSENNVYSGKRAIYINEALPNCSLSVIDEDPCVFGIITNNTNGSSGKYNDTTTEFCTSLNDSVRVNSLGEGAIWVSNINGHIQNGDWITTSRIPGVGKKQNEIRRCNYTVAKATMSCNFDLGSDKYKSKKVKFEGQTYVMAFISVTYHCG